MFQTNSQPAASALAQVFWRSSSATTPPGPPPSSTTSLRRPCLRLAAPRPAALQLRLRGRRLRARLRIWIPSLQLLTPALRSWLRERRELLLRPRATRSPVTARTRTRVCSWRVSSTRPRRAAPSLHRCHRLLRQRAARLHRHPRRRPLARRRWRALLAPRSALHLRSALALRAVRLLRFSALRVLQSVTSRSPECVVPRAFLFAFSVSHPAFF